MVLGKAKDAAPGERLPTNHQVQHRQQLGTHRNSPPPAVLRLCAVDWLCSRALTKNTGDPMSAPAAPHAAPAARFRKKKATLPLFSASTPRAFCTGANRDRRVPFIKTCFVVVEIFEGAVAVVGAAVLVIGKCRGRRVGKAAFERMVWS